MLKLSDALGAVLRDLTQARAQSDLAAREIAIAYAKDPVLKHFPAPRADIREATVEITLALAPLGADAGEPDSRAIALAISESADALRAEALTVRVVRQSGATSRRIQLGRLAAAERARLEGQLKAGLDPLVKSSLGDLVGAFLEDRGKFRDRARELLLKALPAALQQADIEGKFDEGSEKDADAAAGQWETAVESRLAPAGGGDQEIALVVDLRPDVLQKLPAHALSRVSLTIALESYDILEPEEGDKDGDAGLPRLRPR